MTTRIIGPSPASTPAITGAPASTRYPLPDDLLRDASRRLGIMSLMGTILWITGWTLNYFAQKVMTAAHPMPGGLQVSDYVSFASASLSFLLFLYTRKSKRSPAFLLDLGLWYLVLTSAAIGSMWHGAPEPGGHTQIFPMFTWIGPLVLMFAAILPT